MLSCIPEGRAPTVSWWLRGLAMCWVVTAVPTLSNISGPWTKSVTHTTKGGHAKKMNRYCVVNTLYIYDELKHTDDIPNTLFESSCSSSVMKVTSLD